MSQAKTAQPIRAKAPQRLLSELSELSRRHCICSFVAVDNILDLDYLKGLFAPIEQARGTALGGGVLSNQFWGQVKVKVAQTEVALGLDCLGLSLGRSVGSVHVLEGWTSPFQEES